MRMEKTSGSPSRHAITCGSASGSPQNEHLFVAPAGGTYDFDSTTTDYDGVLANAVSQQTKELGLRHALAFKLFESKGISEREQSQTEPRESLIADVTGDGLDDLVLLSHDRVLVYPQDDGK